MKALEKLLARLHDARHVLEGSHKEESDAVSHVIFLLEVERDPAHATCREVEQRLRMANRRLQASGPALERDALVAALRGEVGRLNALIDRLLNEG